MALTPDERDAIAALDGTAMLERTRRWATQNSGSRNLSGLAAMAGLLADTFAALPGNLRLVPAAASDAMASDGGIVEQPHGENLLLVVRPDAPIRMLVTGHMDTVYGSDHAFQSVSDLGEGRVGGPGVADMKGGLAVIHAALAELEKAPGADRLGYDLIINSDEEVGSPGSAALIAERARGKAAAFTYEPAQRPDGTLAGARPGSGNFSLAVRGRSAHAGRNPEEGRNALVAAADLALRLAGARSEGLTVNPARIEGGGPNNVVPDFALLRVNMRPRGAADQNRAEGAIATATAAVETEHDVRVTRHGGFGRPPKPVDAGAQRLFGLVAGCGADLGISIETAASGGVCDGNNIAACGVPVIDTMGVRGGAIHSPEEYLIVDSLAERAALSLVAMMRIARGGF